MRLIHKDNGIFWNIIKKTWRWPPPCLFDYIPKNAIVFMDESHVSVPQIGGMYKGDRSRKETLVEYGFRLPSALDNRPLRFEEWELPFFKPERSVI